MSIDIKALTKIQLANNKLLMLHEAPLFRKVSSWRNSNITTLSHLYKALETIEVETFWDNAQNQLLGTFRSELKRTMNTFDNSLLSSVELRLQDLFFENAFEEYMNTTALEQATGIKDSLKNDILNILKDSLKRELSNIQIARLINAEKQFTKHRARAIARTETHNAANFIKERRSFDIQNLTGQQLYKVWVPSLDERTRVDHAAMLGKPAVRLEESFTVGGKSMKYPGDPAGGAAQVINCRCVTFRGFAENMRRLGYDV